MSDRHEITVYGASDDLIEVEGALREEFYLKDDDDGDLLAFSNGVILRVRYGKDGVWRIEPLVGYGVTIDPGVAADDDNYSDRATFSVTKPAWVVHGTACAWTKP